MEFALSQAVASGDTFDYTMSIYCTEELLSRVVFRRLNQAAA